MDDVTEEAEEVENGDKRTCSGCSLRETHEDLRPREQHVAAIHDRFSIIINGEIRVRARHAR